MVRRLHEVLGRLAGTEGSRSLITRALSLSQLEVPWLRNVHPAPTGLRMDLAATDVPADHAERLHGEVTLVAHVLELLFTFIGERLTLQVIREGWPDLTHERDDVLKDPNP